MTALRLQTEGRHQTSPAALQGLKQWEGQLKMLGAENFFCVEGINYLVSIVLVWLKRIAWKRKWECITILQHINTVTLWKWNTNRSD